MKRLIFKTFAFVSLLLGAGQHLFAQLQSPSAQKEEIRIQMWAELDAFPGLFGDEGFEQKEFTPEAKGFTDNMEENRKMLYGFAIGRMKELTPYLVNGMINGWTFDYMPSDRARGVQEFFEFGQIREFDSFMNPIDYRAPEVIDDRLVVWAYCDRTIYQQQEFERWQSINHPRVRGAGSSPVSKGFEGIQEACGEAVKNGVREYWRTVEKNKPKEITGVLLIIGNPRIFIKDGLYNVQLDFFLETDKIIRYKYN